MNSWQQVTVVLAVVGFFTVIYVAWILIREIIKAMIGAAE